jgi:hypothetical protein
MRGGAWPLLGFGCLMLVMMTFNWIWTDDTIQVASFGFAAVALLTAAGVAILRSGREAIRRGPPQPSSAPHAIPSASLGAVGIAFGVAAILFGFVFGFFLVLIGAGLLLASACLVARELRAERRASRVWRERERR